ncbi:hypothetical protein [Burkholderia sp. FL-7-2-10-S1-D7]|uniref:hypothetical protein n=1 Tax=Burkholderia sp. FL-7-2-10-S1-D7 TaxID=1637866 RepID=UPI000A9C69A4|nr:hypothetical protein [Burkholderia sp. FL-7-2-10-S1-D7]
MQASSAFLTAKQSATMTGGRFFDAVVDRDVLGQIPGDESNARVRAGAQGQVEATRIKLGNVRHRIIGVIAQMTPRASRRDAWHARRCKRPRPAGAGRDATQATSRSRCR